MVTYHLLSKITSLMRDRDRDRDHADESGVATPVRRRSSITFFVAEVLALPRRGLLMSIIRAYASTEFLFAVFSCSPLGLLL